MGLFDKKDKKRNDDFDSPVDRVELGASAKPAAAEPAKAASAPAAGAPATAAPAPAAAPAPSGAASAPAARAAAPAPSNTDHDDYGIDKAIELMRTLPSENIELVVQVVKFSLESVGIHLPTIIQDAIRRQNDLQGRVASLKAEIADLEAEIKTRREEIAKHEGDHKETTMVRERLELAEKIGKGGKAGAAAAPVTSSASATASSSDAGKSESAPSSGSGTLPSLGGTHRNHPVTGQTAVIPPKK